MKKIISIIGARPQFIKYAPLSLALKGKVNDIAIHSGQHYDKEMSDVFFEELKIPQPKYMLNVGSGTHGVQTGKMLIQLDPIFAEEAPDAVIVFGDTNTTLAGTLSAAKLNIPVIHIEAGLRSFNREMPEELNRIAVDHLSSLLFAPTQEAINNLLTEGIKDNVMLSGDLMADSLRIARDYLKESGVLSPVADNFYLATIHRNYNTDSIERLVEILQSFDDLDKQVIFPIHPRTKNFLNSANIQLENCKNIHFLSPLGYFSFINYMSNCSAVITDSGGIQKEAYILKKPCITLRYETEWVETLKGNWNILAGNTLTELKYLVKKSQGNYVPGIYGNGFSAQDIVENILKYIDNE